MPVVNLSSINLVSSSIDSSLVVGSVIESDSGFDYPFLVTNNKDLDFFGEFPFKDFYRTMLTKCSLLLIRPLKVNSYLNKSTLRFNSDVDIPYCSPIFHTDDDDSLTYTRTQSSKVYSDKVAYGFQYSIREDVELDNRSYIVIPRYPLFRDLFWFRQEVGTRPFISTTYVDGSYPLSILTGIEIAVTSIITTLRARTGVTVGGLFYTTDSEGHRWLNFKVTSDKPLESLHFHRMVVKEYGFEKSVVKVTPLTAVTEKALTKLTESSKLIQFNSKVLGSSGDNIKVSIVHLVGFRYQITITMFDHLESFLVSTAEEYDSEGNYIFIDDVLDFSQLVDVVMFGTDFLLPEGDFWLRNSQKELFVNSDYKRSCDLIVSEEKYFDLFVANSIKNLTLIGYYKELMTATDSIAFISLSPKVIRPDLILEFTPDTRLLYFEEKLFVDTTFYPGSFPYIMNFIDGAYLKKVSKDIRRFPSASDELLEEKHINFISTNNFTYYYNSIVVGVESLHLLIRFVLSRIARQFKSNKDNLTGLTTEDTDEKIRYLIKSIRVNTPILSSIDYTFEQSGNTLQVTVNSRFSKLAKAEYKLTLTLNYKTYA